LKQSLRDLAISESLYLEYKTVPEDKQTGNCNQ